MKAATNKNCAYEISKRHKRYAYRLSTPQYIKQSPNLFKGRTEPILMDMVTVNKLVSLLKPHGVGKIGIFGSFARGDFNEESNIDVLIEFSKRKSLLEIVHIENEVSENLGRRVELLTETSSNKAIFE
jgi:predicted nucleotidyltransferase